MMESGIRWTAMLALVFAFGLSACGGDANGNSTDDGAASPGDAAAQTADEGNNAGDDVVEAIDEAADDVGDFVEKTADDVSDAFSKQELPEGVTAEMVEQGKAVYGGAGICSSCHGPAGAGIPSLGADLTDSEWLHSDGSYEGMVKTVMEGVTAQASSSGVPMPAKGGTNISDDDVKAVSAYVWTLSK
jgi:mono/diheme cytochrome c family protein